MFTCNECIELAVLVKEVSGLRQMVEDVTDSVVGLRFEDEESETRNIVTTI